LSSPLSKIQIRHAPREAEENDNLEKLRPYLLLSLDLLKRLQEYSIGQREDDCGMQKA
jgi:hypothetical protein